MKTLKEQIDNRYTRYDMAKCAFLVIEPRDERTVQKEDGSYGDVVMSEGLTMTRASSGTTLSHKLDPVENKETVDKCDKWISEHSRYAQKIGFRKIGSNRPDERIENWDNMDLDQIEAVVRATNANLLHAYEYELHHPDGARDEVLDLLEEINKTGDVQKAEVSEEAPAI